MFFSDLRNRLRPTEVVTDAECEDLRTEISKLQRELHQIVDQEIVSNNEACGVATNGIVQLHIEMDKLTAERSRLKTERNVESESLKALERQCEEEFDSRRKCQEDITRLSSAMESAKAESKALRAEIDQLNYFQQQVDNETYFRLRADVQNLETDKDRDVIHLRHLKSERDKLQTELNQLCAERDAFEVIAQKWEKEIGDERMTIDMYKAHQEALHEHAERLGLAGKNQLVDMLSPDNMISSFRGFFKNRRASNDDSGQPMNPTNNTIKTNRERIKGDPAEKTSPPSDKSPGVGGGGGAAVGGIAYTDSFPSSDLFRKSPTIFKIGGENNNRSKDDTILNSTANEDREISIDKDATSASSSITMSDEELTASMTEKSSGAH